MRGIIKIFCPRCGRGWRVRTIEQFSEIQDVKKCPRCDELLEIEVVIEDD